MSGSIWAVTEDFKLRELPVLECRGPHGYVIRPPQGGRARCLQVNRSTRPPAAWGLRIINEDRAAAVSTLRFLVETGEAALAHRAASEARAALSALGLGAGATVAAVCAAFAERMRALHGDAGTVDLAGVRELVSLRDAALSALDA